MSKAAVVFWSSTGNTEACAQFVAEGAKGAGVEVEVFSVDQFDAANAAAYDAFALGCPAMGDEELEDSEFQPFYESIKADLASRKVVLFGSYDWGEGDWMKSWKEDAESAGITLAADPVIVNNDPGDDDAEALKALGAALA